MSGGGDAITADQLLASPALYLTDFSPKTGAAVLSRMSRQTYRDSVMLDQRIVTLGPAAASPSIDSIHDLLTGQGTPAPIAWIQHIAFCGSTLLARALDVPGAGFALKEPFTLHRLAWIRRRIETGEAAGLGIDWERAHHAVCTLLARTWAPTERAVVKPTDSCNNIIEACLTLNAESRSLLMYSTLDDFVISTLKTAGRREYLRNQLNRTQNDAAAYTHLATIDTDGMKDAQLAAFAWLVQMNGYQDRIDAGDDRIATLDGRRFLSEPAAALPAIARFLGVTMTERQLADMLASDVFTRHSKMAVRAFDKDAYASEQRAIRTRLAPEIEAARRFAEPYLEQRAIPERLDRDVLS